jgi:hypothetical protein
MQTFFLFNGIFYIYISNCRIILIIVCRAMAVNAAQNPNESKARAERSTDFDIL